MQLALVNFFSVFMLLLILEFCVLLYIEIVVYVTLKGENPTQSDAQLKCNAIQQQKKSLIFTAQSFKL